MAQTLHITVDGGVGGGAVINAKLDGVQFFNAIGSAPDNLTYDNYIGTIQTNNGVLDLLVIPPPSNTGTLVIRLTGAVTQDINVVAAGSTTGSGYNNFMRSIPIGEIPQPISPELSEYFDLGAGAYFSGTSIVVTGESPATHLDGGASVTIKKLPESGSLVFDVSCTEFLIDVLNQYYITTGGGSDWRYKVQGVPSLAGNANGVYYGDLRQRETYEGVITISNTTVPRTVTFCNGIWTMRDIAPAESDDPYSPGGGGSGGGNGTFDLTSDTISIPGLPSLSATNAGLVTVYVPTTSELSRFGSLLFGSTFINAFLNAVTTLFVDPLEAVIGLAILPVSPTLLNARQVSVAFIGLSDSDGALYMRPAASQYVEVDCGSIEIKEFSGSALDYSPYSKFHIYLPYIGTRDLSTDEIRGKTIHVKYHVDIVSGSCVAFIEVNGTVLYQFAGNCATPIPINGRDFSRMVTAGIQLAAAFVGATPGSGAGVASAGNVMPPSDSISTPSSFNTLSKALDSNEGLAQNITPSNKGKAGGLPDSEHLISATAGVVSSMKPHIQHASGIGGAAGMLGVQKPYLIAEIPRQSLAQDYNKFIGYPSNITALLGDLTGFTQIELIHLKDIPCTETELAEIDKMLREGIIL